MPWRNSVACPSQPYPMSYVPTHNVSDLALDRSYESNSLHSVEPVFRMAEHPFGGGVARTILAAQEADSRPSAKIGTLWSIQQKNTEHASLVPPQNGTPSTGRFSHLALSAWRFVSYKSHANRDASQRYRQSRHRWSLNMSHSASWR